MLQFGLLFVLLVTIRAQCPITIRKPCNCATTRYEPVSIVCDGANSLAATLLAIGNTGVMIDSLIISNTPIEELPGFAFRGFMVKRLVLRNNGLTSIHPQAFDGEMIQSLTELEIRNNRLGEIPQSGIPTLQNLRTLVLAKNGITSMPPNAFITYSSRTRMRRLDLSANRLTKIPAGVFAGLESIREISLDKNYLGEIPTEALRPLNTLEDLSFSVNRLASVPIGSLNFRNLKSLSFEVNNIEYIEAEAFQLVPNLLYLYLSSNKFTTINPQIFYYTSNLKVLAMGNNEMIQEIPSNAFQYTPELVRLEMSECSIRNVAPGALQKISKVQVIVLNKNQLTTITGDMFRGLSELVSLDLKGNELKFIEDASFSALPKLKHLDLSSNKIETLKPNTFAGTLQKHSPSTARVLYIYENKWVCDKDIDWFRRWLRDNTDIIIDAPGYDISQCWKPAQLYQLAMRKENPTGSMIIPRETIKQGNKKRIDPGKEPLEQKNNEVDEGSGVVVFIILGVILGIFCLSLFLLMIVKCFVSKSRRDRKEDEETRRFGTGSMVSGYQFGSASAYPGATTPESGSLAQRSPNQRGYFLNRPWYWWF